MAFQDKLQQLQNFDVASLDMNNPGDWPGPVKGIALVLVFALAVAGGYFGYLTGKLEQLERIARQEATLRTEFDNKSRDAANLPLLRRQQQEMEESFGALLRQLPTDTEVPGLLEDITMTGLDAGLKFSAIDLQAERTAEFYRELPIQITVSGTYHAMGAFVSGVANLSRIVTLHDFNISPAGGARARRGGDGEGELTMQIQARTYRYQDGGS
jgi:type IV pilus assembly protein PilO